MEDAQKDDVSVTCVKFAVAQDDKGFYAVFQMGDVEDGLGPFPSKEWAKRACQWAVQIMNAAMQETGAETVIASRESMNGVN